MISRFFKFFSLLFKWPWYRLRKNKISLLTSVIEKRTYLRNCQIGDYVFIGRDCVINNAQIGNYTCIADAVQIGGMEHPYWDISISPKLSKQFIFKNQTTIGNDVWIAAGCIIKQGVNIGDGAVVGANSFVTKDVPPYAIVFGTPAKIYKYRFSDEKIKMILDSCYFENKPDKAKAIIETLKEKTNE